MLERWAAAAGLLVLLAGCGGDEECAWGVDALLREADVRSETRGRCGDLSWLAESGSTPALREAVACLTAARDGGEAAELTINRGIDNPDVETWIATPDGFFRVAMSPGQFGGDREARVEACDDVVAFDSGPACTEPRVLYHCLEDVD